VRIDNNIEIEFPIVNLSISDWNNKDIDYSVIFLCGCKTRIFNQTYLEKYFLNHDFLDSNGNLFKIIEIKSLGKWKKHIPFVFRNTLVYSSLDENISLEKAKKIILKKIEDFDDKNDEFLNDWKKIIKTSKTYEGIMLY